MILRELRGVVLGGGLVSFLAVAFHAHRFEVRDYVKKAASKPASFALHFLYRCLQFSANNTHETTPL